MQFKICSIKPVYILVFLGMLLSGPVRAQDCIQALQQATNSYRSGYVYEVVPLLAPHLHSSCLGRAQKAVAYRLLAHVYAELGKKDSADYAVKKMLLFNPHYKLQDGEDLQEFADLFHSYRVYPRFVLGIMGSFNFTHPQLYSRRHIMEEEKSNELYYGLPGYSIELRTSFSLTSALFFNTGLNFSYNNFSRRMYGVIDLNSNDYHYEYLHWRYSYKQHINYLEVPFCLSYHFGRKKVRPFVAAGGYFGYLSYSSKVLSWDLRLFGTDSEEFRVSDTSPGNPTSAMHRNQTYGVVFAGGATYTLLPNLNIGLEGVYLRGLTRQGQNVALAPPADNEFFSNNAASRLRDQVFNGFDLLEEFSLHHLRLQVSISYAIRYRAIKIKQSKN